MGLLRLAGLLTVLFIAACAVLHIYTGERRYRTLALRAAKYALWVVLLLFVVLSADRLHPFL